MARAKISGVKRLPRDATVSQRHALIDIVWMYLLAAIIGVLAYVYVPVLVLIGPLEIWAGVPTERMGRFLIADLAMTFFIYGCSVAKKNGSAYDAYWSVIPFYLVLALIWNSASQTVGWAQWATAILVSAWSWRLTLNWARGWTGWDHEDWRYVDFRKSHGRAFELTNLFGIHLFPTVIVFAGCLGLFWVFEPRERDAIWYALGLVVGFIGVALEFLADNELARFRQRPTPSSEDILDTGIWGRLRYPNYLGEMMFWFGVTFCGFGAGAPVGTIIGALAMVALFVFATIPMKEKRMASRKPGFQDYCDRVPALWPRFRERRS